MFTRTFMLSAAAIIAIAGTSAQAEIIYGITQDQKIVSWDSSNPSALISARSISGMQSNEIIQSIDYRAANGQIYALGSFDRLYTINPANGTVTQVGSQFNIQLDGSNFGFDFNPVIDRIRVTSDTNRNYVINPNDGSITQVTNLFYGPADPNFGRDPNVINSAYTNNTVNAVSTQLYGIDAGLDILVTQANSAGTLGTVGPLGMDITALGGFDISGESGIAYAAVQNSALSKSSFVTVNLVTGAMTNFGQIDGGIVITAMTVAPANVPAPAGGVLLGLGALAMRRHRR